MDQTIRRFHSPNMRWTVGAANQSKLATTMSKRIKPARFGSAQFLHKEGHGVFPYRQYGSEIRVRAHVVWLEQVEPFLEGLAIVMRPFFASSKRKGDESNR
jgi:hypothetical protein